VIGRSLGQYRIDGMLGRGGMGVVYAAHDTRLDRPVALKVLSEALTDDPDRRRRFLHEARAACAVNHPAIAQIYDADEVEGVTFIAMERVDGATLRDLIVRRELDLPGAVTIAVQVGRGLARAHEAGIVHRDIKAENVMVTRDGHAKILDFGLAKRLEPSGDGGNPSLLETLHQTKAGMILGTVAYMSPEQARGHPVDRRSDVFSLGVLLYEMVTGQLPFQGSSPLDTLHAIAFDETRPVTTVRANLPPSLHRVVSRALRKRPEDRYDDARAFASDLEGVQREIETGISRAVPLRDRVREGWRSLREKTPSEWGWPLLATIVVVGLVTVLAVRGSAALPTLLLTGFVGLVLWRRLRNRRLRLRQRFASKVRKLPEVRVIACQGSHLTVVVDRAVARTYVRANAVLDAVNAKLYTGDPYTMEIRDDLSAAEVRALLAGPGVLFVRADVLEQPAAV
jgi:predicted Ser/Thr protein kinase